ncbi:MAG: transglycosylase SLT domain-containing protein, partial [Proteobacteria bacterium]|nr:transglycosylase SLT domain-containing protein [Pseudomonadota bacterium]
MPYFYFNKISYLRMYRGGIPNLKRALSKFRQLLADTFLGGIVLTLLTTHAAIADSTGKQLPYRDCFEATANTYNLDSDWLTAIAIVESSLNPRAVSSANAVGLMQIKWPQTAAHLGARSRAALFDPCTNVDLGGRYLRELTDRYEGDMQRALAAYRIGPTALTRTSSEPEVVLEYRRRINEQLDILRPNRASNYISQVSLPSEPAPKPAKIEPEPLKKKAPPSQIVMAASTPATAPAPAP